MNFIGQYIQSLVARFRSAVYLENLVDPGSDTDKFLVASSDGKVGYRTGAEVASDIGVSGTFVDLTSEVSGVLPVSNGGTGASSLTATSLLTGNGTSAVQAESGLIYGGEILVIGDADAGIAEISRKNSATATAGQFRLRGSTATGADKVGGELSLAGGPGTGTGAGGAIKFYNWTPYGGSSSLGQTVAVEIAGFDSAGNLQIDGGLTTGSTSAINSSGVIQVASQPNITTLAGVFTGAANQLLTDDGDGTVTSESHLTFASSTLELGGDTFDSFSIQRKNHSDNIGGELRIFSGAGGGTNKAGGDLIFKSGKGTGTALGGAIEFYVSTAGSSGDTAHFLQGINMKITDGLVAVTGNISVTGTVDGVDIAARDHAAVTLANTNYLSLSGQEVTGGTVPVGSGGTGATTFTSGHILRGNGTSAFTADTDLMFSGGNLNIQSSTSAKPVIQLNNTNTDAEASELQFIKGTAGADGDDLGKIKFEGFDPNGNQHTFAQALGEIVVAADGSEEGKLTLSVASHDAELRPGLILASGNAEDEVDVTIGGEATSVTTIAGTLTMGSTATINNSGVIQVATQGTIDHDSLANFVAAEHYRWDTDISGTATINAANIPTLNQDTTGNATTATNLTVGDKTISGKLSTKSFLIDANLSITPGDGSAIHVDASDMTDDATSASGTAAMYNHVTFENPRILATNASVTTTNASTFFIKGAPVASTNQTITNAYAFYVNSGDAYFGGDLTVNGDSVTFESANADDPIFTLKNTSNDTNDPAQMIFVKDRGTAPAVGTNLGEVRFVGEDSGQNSQEYGGFLCEIDVATDGQESGQFGIWVATHDGELQYGLQLTGGSEEDEVDVSIAQGANSSTSVAGNLDVTGIITGKRREVFFQNFFDDLGTTKHYLPFKSQSEQTTIYQEEVAVVMPCDGRIVSITLRVMFPNADGEITMGIHTRPVNVNAFTTASWVEEETEMLPLVNADDSHVFHFAFDNAKHFESSELVAISMQCSADISTSAYWHVSTVIEYDWSTFLGTTSVEIESTP